MDGTIKKYLWTGAHTLTRGERTQFGSIGATSPLSEAGTVALHLRTADVPAHVEHAGINLELPEAWASELARKLLLVTTQIAHLRSLHRQGFLAPDAVYEENAAPPDGDRVDDTADERVVPFDRNAPEPLGSASVHVEAANVWLTYQTATGSARILLEQVDALRTSRVTMFPREPILNPQPFISIVECSRWRRERQHFIALEEMDDLPVERHHFQFRFKELLIEAIASRITPTREDMDS